MKGNKKLIVILAIALVVVIVLIFKGGGSSDAKEILKENLENKNYSVSNIKEEFKDSFKVQSVDMDGNFEKATLYVLSCETEIGNNPNTHRYGAYTVMVNKDGTSSVHFEFDCSDKKEFKALLKQTIKSHKESIKQGKKDKTIK